MNLMVHHRKPILACKRILQETTLTTKSKEARARAEASFRKAERAKEGQEAMMEDQANIRMVREKTERLKVLRWLKRQPTGSAPVNHYDALKRTHRRPI